MTAPDDFAAALERLKAKVSKSLRIAEERSHSSNVEIRNAYKTPLPVSVPVVDALDLLAHVAALEQRLAGISDPDGGGPGAYYSEAYVEARAAEYVALEQRCLAAKARADHWAATSELGHDALAKTVERCRRYERALRPFAEYAKCLPRDHGGERLTDSGPVLTSDSARGRFVITFADLRAARAALSDPSGGETEES